MSNKFIITLAVACGVVLGAIASDVAALKRFPHGRYLLEMNLDGSSWSNYVCERNGSAFGENFSSFDHEKNVQKDCLLYVSGEPQSDGSLKVYLGSQTWLGRIRGGMAPVVVPASAIRSVRPAAI